MLVVLNEVRNVLQGSEVVFLVMIKNLFFLHLESLQESLHKKHGNQWKYLSTLIGRSRLSITEKWRCMRRAKATGVWTREELQQLSDLVHSCLRFKMLEDKSCRKLLRDNITWDKIADTIGTHSHANCCKKWYGSLSAAMVADGLWASKDDFLLLESLLESGACMEEEVDWDSLLSHRSGQTCLFRWKQLAKHLGENRTRGFLEKLNDLVHRYAPELLFSDGNLTASKAFLE
ncbi:hypothetical protein L7F22_024416 [Adiantum nelumboides]|nr:hypothetical protein [Adiantum nelumboides]